MYIEIHLSSGKIFSEDIHVYSIDHDVICSLFLSVAPEDIRLACKKFRSDQTF